MDVIHRAVDAVAVHAPRVGLVLKADIRNDRQDTAEAKVARLEEDLAGGRP